MFVWQFRTQKDDDVVFSDASTLVRPLFWETSLKQALGRTRVTKLPVRLRLTLLDYLRCAA